MGDDEIKALYSAAREEDVGTVSRIDIPEGSISIVNLVDVARYIQKSMYGIDTLEAEEEEEEDITSDGYDEYELDEEDSSETLDVESKSDLSGNVSAGAAAVQVKRDLEIPRPVVYSGPLRTTRRKQANSQGLRPWQGSVEDSLQAY